MKNAVDYIKHIFGFEKLNRFEKEYLHDANIQSGIYMGSIAALLEIWMLMRQTFVKIIPKYTDGGDLFSLIVANTSKYWLFLLFGLGLLLMCLFCQKDKQLTKRRYATLLVIGVICMLYSCVVFLESFVSAGEETTPTMASITNVLIISIYFILFLFGISIIANAVYNHNKGKNSFILENLTIILFALVNAAFGFLVSYTDFWGGKEITCFLTMMIYVGSLLIYRPYITLLILGSSFYAFYRIMLTFQEGVSFKAREVIIFGTPHMVSSGDTINYITFFISLTTICLVMYHGRLKEARKTQRLQKVSVELEKKHKEAYDLFVQTTEALASAIDAKDTYTNGHSRRVAQYAEKIARQMGKNSEECNRIYSAALVHDVGKIGVPNEILTKNTRLTNEEFARIKEHPVAGGEILSKITQSPWLRLGALHHHERYDGKGYPEGLKGEDIPEISRIIAVADAYDAMTSNRSYREAIPQHIVREELVKGIGTQFDPDLAKIMIHMIDMDIEYRMKESVTGSNVSKTDTLHCKSIYNDCSDGITITRKKVDISFLWRPDEGSDEKESLPTLIVFDSLDSNVHPGEENNKDLLYFEYATIRADGHVNEKNVRKSEVRQLEQEEYTQKNDNQSSGYDQNYKISAVRNRDHVQICIKGAKKAFEVILALPDTSRYTSIAITGENGSIYKIMPTVEEKETDSDAIPRIAEEISYVKECPVGDIPNIEIDGPRFAATKGIPIRKDMTVSFHTFSYPTARLVWHCPYFCIFYSQNGQLDGKNYREYLLLKMDGENWESEERVDNDVKVEQGPDFEGWQTWIEQNKQGLDCTIMIRRQDNKVIMQTENLGIAINSVTTVLDDTDDLYFALTGDQCAISDIRIS